MWMPVGHFQSEKGLYAEFRYNYEDVRTFSLYGGKNFSGGKVMKYSATPMLGYSFGNFEGLSVAANTDLEWKSLYFSSQTQYSFSTQTNADHFFFSWSEVGVSISEKIFAGFAMQYTGQRNETLTETGFVAGLNFGNLTIPVYVFNPFVSNRYFVFGLNYEMNFKKNKIR